MLNKIALAISLFVLSFVATRYLNAEASIPGIGFYENANEILAKDKAVGAGFTKIYDYNTSPNQNGENIGNGQYYVPIQYNGGNNGTDTDYIKLEDIKGAKGDKGDRGEVGAVGATGAKGDRGEPGFTGNVGATGATGETGARGSNGVKGDAGVSGANGKDGVNGADGTDGVDGEDGTDGKDGAKGEKGLDTDKRAMPVVLETAVRFYDSKYVQLQAFYAYDFANSQSHVAGARVVFKVGKSYEEKYMEKMHKQYMAEHQQLVVLLDRLHDQMPNSIWFVSTNKEVEKKTRKDPKYIKALLETKGKDGKPAVRQ